MKKLLLTLALASSFSVNAYDVVWESKKAYSSQGTATATLFMNGNSEKNHVRILVENSDPSFCSTVEHNVANEVSGKVVKMIGLSGLASDGRCSMSYFAKTDEGQSWLIKSFIMNKNVSFKNQYNINTDHFHSQYFGYSNAI